MAAERPDVVVILRPVLAPCSPSAATWIGIEHVKLLAVARCSLRIIFLFKSRARSSDTL